MHLSVTSRAVYAVFAFLACIAASARAQNSVSFTATINSATQMEVDGEGPYDQLTCVSYTATTSVNEDSLVTGIMEKSVYDAASTYLSTGGGASLSEAAKIEYALDKAVTGSTCQLADFSDSTCTKSNISLDPSKEYVIGYLRKTKATGVTLTGTATEATGCTSGSATVAATIATAAAAATVALL